MGKVSLLGPGGDKKKIIATGKTEGRNETVTLKATGKAIERAMDLGLYFQEQDDLEIKIKTGTLTVVDDIVEDGGLDVEEMIDTDDLPETQIRRLPVLEVAVGFR
jgi:ribonuclease P/MRP protein subunit POP7